VIFLELLLLESNLCFGDVFLGLKEDNFLENCKCHSRVFMVFHVMNVRYDFSIIPYLNAYSYWKILVDHCMLNLLFLECHGRSPRELSPT